MQVRGRDDEGDRDVDLWVAVVLVVLSLVVLALAVVLALGVVGFGPPPFDHPTP